MAYEPRQLSASFSGARCRGKHPALPDCSSEAEREGLWHPGVTVMIALPFGVRRVLLPEFLRYFLSWFIIGLTLILGTLLTTIYYLASGSVTGPILFAVLMAALLAAIGTWLRDPGKPRGVARPEGQGAQPPGAAE